MATIPLPIANGSYQEQSLPASAQRCVNWYPHFLDVEGLSSAILYGTPGLRQVATAGSTIIVANRGSHRMSGKAYFVQGTSLMRLNADHSLDNLGTISGIGRVSMADNGTQLMILVPGGNGYIFTADPDLLVQITDADFTASGNPRQVVFLDGYFICTTDQGDTFIVSAINDGTSWNALDFGTAESSPDSGVTPFVFKNQLYIAGERTIEAFQNIGGADFPFQRSGLFFDRGITSEFAVANTSEAVVFLGAGESEEPAIWALGGTTMEKVSTKAIDQILSRLSEAELAAVFAWSYGQAGHYFVGFQLPDTTIVYDLSTGRWSDRQSRVMSGTSWDIISHRAASYLACYGEIFCGDTEDGRIGILDADTYAEYGNDIVRSVTLQPFQNNMKPMFLPEIEATVESGVGTATLDPQISFSISRDGGKNFADPRSRGMGKIGEYNRRAIWRRNGRSARFDVYRFEMSDQVKPTLLQVTAEVTG